MSFAARLNVCDYLPEFVGNCLLSKHRRRADIEREPDQTTDGQPVYDNPSFAHSVIPRAINANGDLVGCIHDKNQGDSMHGFLVHDGTFTILGSMTMNNGVNAEGEIVGLIGGAAYRIDKFGATEPVELAGTDAANAWDINAKGEIVGAAVPDARRSAKSETAEDDGRYN